MKNINPIDQLWALPLIGVALSVLFLKLRLITGEIAAQLFILTAALLAYVFDAEHDLALLTLVPFLTMLGMSHFFLHTHQMLKRKTVIPTSNFWRALAHRFIFMPAGR